MSCMIIERYLCHLETKLIIAATLPYLNSKKLTNILRNAVNYCNMCLWKWRKLTVNVGFDVCVCCWAAENSLVTLCCASISVFAQPQFTYKLLLSSNVQSKTCCIKALSRKVNTVFSRLLSILVPDTFILFQKYTKIMTNGPFLTFFHQADP